MLSHFSVAIMIRAMLIKLGVRGQELAMAKKLCQSPPTAISEENVWSIVGSTEGLNLKKRYFWRYTHKHYVFRKERMALMAFKNIAKKILADRSWQSTNPISF